MQIKKQNHILVPYTIMLILLIVFVLITCSRGHTSESLSSKSKYKIIKPIYLMATYDSLNNKKLSKDTARAYLHAKRYYDKSIVAFQCEVPVGTTMTIIGLAPKIWFLPFSADKYFVQLDPDLSRGLDVVLDLSRGIEGSLDGLNPELFNLQE